VEKIFKVIIFFFIYSSSLFAQRITLKEILGKWRINDIDGIHKNFQVILEFDSTVLREQINRELVLSVGYSIFSDSNKTYLLIAPTGQNLERKNAPFMGLKGDSLTLKNFYFQYKKEYQLDLQDPIYFIRMK
jgi:hypothetical protein